MRNGLSFSEAGKLGAYKTQEILRLKRQQTENEYKENPRLCKNCNSELQYKRRTNVFCSSKCSAIFNNASGKIGGGKYKRKESKKCANCDNAVATRKNKFCSHFCNVEYDWNIKAKQIVEDTDLSSIFKSRPTLKSFLLRVLPQKCSICGIEIWQGVKKEPEPILLIVDHIDGNSENNTQCNLRLVCSNCDATLPTCDNSPH